MMRGWSVYSESLSPWRFLNSVVIVVLRHLRHGMIRGGEYAKSQALKFESIKGVAGLMDTMVNYIPDPGVREGFLDFWGTSEGESEDGEDE